MASFFHRAREPADPAKPLETDLGKILFPKHVVSATYGRPSEKAIRADAARVYAVQEAIPVMTGNREESTMLHELLNCARR